MTSGDLVSATSAGVSVVVVPNVFPGVSTALFRDLDCIVLEDLLMQGNAALIFRRLRLAAFVDVSKREVYNRIRYEYLQRLLNSHLLNSTRRVVVIATDPSDVDLLECDDVTVVEMPDLQLRQLSLDIYGEPLMLPTEYACVKSMLDDADIMRMHVTDFSRLPTQLLRVWPQLAADRTMLTPILSDYGLVCEVVQKMGLSSVWLEAESSVVYSMGNYAVRAECEYLHAIKLEWRDAVIRILGRAPEVSRIFKLPWFVAKQSAVASLCYRTSVNGQMVVAMNGGSLATFVRSNLATYFDRRELIGTWIGAMLYDPTVASMVEYAPTSDMAVKVTPGVKLSVDKPVLRVPEKYRWAYAACDDVNFVAEDFDGDLWSDHEWCLRNNWDSALPLVQVFCSPGTAFAVAEVTSFVWRMHYLPNLCNVVASAVAVWLTQGPGHLSDADMALITLLPGLTYLRWVPTNCQHDIFYQLGVFPDKNYMVKVLFSQPWCDDFLQSNIRDEIGSVDLVAGDAGKEVWWHHLKEVPVQSIVAMYPPGWCYLAMIPRRKRMSAVKQYGVYPKLGILVKHLLASGDVDLLRSVKLVLTGNFDSGGAPVLHATFDQGVPVMSFIEAVPLVKDSGGKLVSLVECVVGAVMPRQASDTCVDAAWRTGAIISVTALVAWLLVYLGFLLYKCRVGKAKAVTASHRLGRY